MHRFTRPLLGLILIAGGHGPLAARDGRIGPHSAGTLTIRVWVTPRTWRPDAQTLCFAAPRGAFSIVDGGAAWSVPTSRSIDARCGGTAQGIALPHGVGTTTLIIRAE